MSIIPDGDSLYGRVVRRIRAANTVFKDNVKLSLRQSDEEQLSRLAKPFALVVPTIDRPLASPVINDYASVTAPRSIAIIAQFDGFSSDQEHLAAAAIEVARYQLLNCLVNWRPFPHYDATGYGGMRIEAVKAPAVRVSFVFLFNEHLNFSGCESDDCGAGFDTTWSISAISECEEPICK